jgi:tetratricopeptide (TPR) repeat protein
MITVITRIEKVILFMNSHILDAWKKLIPFVFVVCAFSLVACQTQQDQTWKKDVTLALEHYYKGHQHLLKKEFADAEKEYLASIEISPRPLAYYRLALIQDETGRTKEALDSLNKAVKLNPNYQRVLLLKERLEMRLSGKPAASESQASLIKTPKTVQLPEKKEIVAPIVVESPDASPIISKTKQDKKPAQQAVSLAGSEKVTKKKDHDFETWMKEAGEARDAGNWELAFNNYKKILKKNPSNAKTLYNFGYVCFQLDKLDIAESSIKKAIELDPGMISAYNDLGVVLEKQQKTGEAIQAYKKAIDLGPNQDACFNMALLNEKHGKYKESVELYEKYVELDSTSTYTNFAKQRISKLRRLAY